MLVVVSLLEQLGLLGGWVCLEHPDDPGPPYPSLFATQRCLDFRQNLWLASIRLYQCMYGAPIGKTDQ
eukprot:3673823-Karenia_brevis.AAC.1